MSEKRRGQFLVFEGIDGSGKTTLSRMTHVHLKDRGLPVIWLREPSDSPWGKKIRKLADTRSGIPIEEELSYFLRDRRWNVSHHILPALKRGDHIVLDRYFYSTACYQGARGFDLEAILAENREFAPEPDLVFIIDVDVETGMERISRNRTSTAKLFETREFLIRVRANYRSLKGKNIVHIDGSRDLETVFSDILSRL
jgi:dTMP kinase